MKKIFLINLLFFVSISLAQNKNLNLLDDINFNGKNAWLIDSILCTYEFAGRKSGLQSSEVTTKFISSKFKEWNLKPKGDNNSFIQKFPMLATYEFGEQELIIKNTRRGELKLHEGDDFAVFTNSGSNILESEIVFAGYGIEDSLWNDYKDIDVKNKVVLLLAGSPKKYDLSNKEDRNSKYKKACEKGASAVLICNVSTNRIIKGAAISEENYNDKVPGAYIHDWVLRELFKGTGKSVEQILDILGEKPFSFSTNKKVYVNFNLRKIENAYCENVIGLIEGKERKDEYIVIGAHIDHLGISPNGYIYSGADDNGSGTSLLMELSRVFSKRLNLKRNLLFIGFGGEEQGLLGSNYFVNYPTIPKEKIAVMLNFDMVGVGDGGIGISGIETIRKIWEEFYSTLSDNDKKKIRTGRAGIGGTDHTAFKLDGIPALSSASTGRHYFYHDPDDKYDYVDSTVFHSVGNIVQKLVEFLANYEVEIIHKFRNEKNLVDDCNLVDFSNYQNIITIKDKNNIKKNILSGIKFIPIYIDGNENSFIFDLGKFINITKTEKENLNYVKNITEIKNNIYSNNLTVFPVIKNYSGNKDVYNILNELGYNTFEFNEKNHDEFNKLQNSVIIMDLDNFLKYDCKRENKYLINGDFKDFNKHLKNIKDKIKKNILFVINLNNNSDVDEISDLVKQIGLNKVYIDLCSILKSQENNVYELVKKLKLSGYSNNNIKKLLGDNLIKFF